MQLLHAVSYRCTIHKQLLQSTYAFACKDFWANEHTTRTKLTKSRIQYMQWLNCSLHYRCDTHFVGTVTANMSSSEWQVRISHCVIDMGTAASKRELMHSYAAGSRRRAATMRARSIDTVKWESTTR